MKALHIFLLVSLCLLNIAPLSANPINILEEKAKLEAQKTLAATTQQGQQEYQDRYRIELLVFAYVNTGEEKSELWRNLQRPHFINQHPAYLPTDTIKTDADDSDDADPIEPTPAPLYAFIELNIESKESPSEFLDILRKMRINGHYRTLQHLMWEQTVLSRKASPLFYLEGGERYPDKQDILNLQNAFTAATFEAAGEPELETEAKDESNAETIALGVPEFAGTLHIYRSRFLHVKPDLWFSQFSENDAGLCLVSEMMTETSDTYTPTSYTALTHYHIDQHRRLRSGELHYIDHPMFGVLIKFTRLGIPETLETEELPIAIDGADDDFQF